MTSLIKLNKIKKIIPLKIYTAWHKDENYWYRPKLETSNCVFMPGIWVSKTSALIDAPEEKYYIIEFNFDDKIPSDIQRVIDLDHDMFYEKEKKDMIKSKFRQMLKTFIFYNKDLKNRLSNG